MTYEFTKYINSTQLMDEFTAAGLAWPDRIDTEGESVHIFYEEELSPELESILITVMDSHVASSNYVSPADQLQIDTLVSYLNSPSPTTAAIARMVVVLNIAPRMPSGMVALINAQIATRLGS